MSFSTLICASLVLAAGSPTPPATSQLPTIDPQARQVLAGMVNAYRFDLDEYADVETIQATGDPKTVSPQFVNCRISVARAVGVGVRLTVTYSSGVKVTVHAFQEKKSLSDAPFLVVTTDSRFPGLYVKNRALSYEGAQKVAFPLIGFFTFGAGALFLEDDVSSALLTPSFRGLQLGPTSEIDGIKCDSVELDLSSNSHISDKATCYVGQQDHLLRRLLIVSVNNGQTTITTENHTQIRTHGFPVYPSMFPPSYFRYTLPHGTRPVKFFPYVPVHIQKSSKD